MIPIAATPATSERVIGPSQDMGAVVRVFDPAGMPQAQACLDNVTCCENAYECAEAADALVIATEWNSSERSSSIACAISWLVPL